MVVAIWEDRVIVIFISPSTQPLQLQLHSYCMQLMGAVLLLLLAGGGGGRGPSTW